MIVLETNVVSELWKPAPSSRVVGWIDAQMLETLYLSAVTVAELRFGLAAMPIGKRRALYLTRLEGEVLPAFRGRVLSFDLDASQAYADLMARQGSGQSHRRGGRLYRRDRRRTKLGDRNARHQPIRGRAPNSG